MPKFSVEQQIEWVVETELKIEKLTLNRYQAEMEEAMAYLDNLETRLGRDRSVSEGLLRQARSVARYRTERFNAEYERIYREGPDEEEVAVGRMDQPEVALAEPESAEEIHQTFSDWMDSDDDNLVGA